MAIFFIALPFAVKDMKCDRRNDGSNVKGRRDYEIEFEFGVFLIKILTVIVLKSIKHYRVTKAHFFL